MTTIQDQIDYIKEWVDKCEADATQIQNSEDEDTSAQEKAGMVAEIRKNGSMLKDVLENLIAVRNNVFAGERETKELVTALFEARDNIRRWHGMGMHPKQEEEMWRIYWGRSPEMRHINALINKYTTEEVRKEPHNG